MHRHKILITGSSGMLGTDLILLLSNKYDVVCTDIVENKEPSCRAKDFLKCDLTDKQATIDMVKKSEAEIVLHTAAWTDVDGCELDKENATMINAKGTHHIALGCQESKALLFYISSDFVFDGNKEEPYVEDDKTNPLNVYGLSKLKGEEAIEKELDRYFIVRTSWLFGKYGRNFVDIILDLAERKKELKVVVDQFGSPTYTKDLSIALEKMVSMALKNKDLGGIYHFCNSGSCSWYKYAEEILRISEKTETKLLPITTAELDRPAPRPRMSILNVDKYSQLSNERPREWQLALQEYLLGDSSKTEVDHVQSTKE